MTLMQRTIIFRSPLPVEATRPGQIIYRALDNYAHAIRPWQFDYPPRKRSEPMHICANIIAIKNGYLVSLEYPGSMHETSLVADRQPEQPTFFANFGEIEAELPGMLREARGKAEAYEQEQKDEMLRWKGVAGGAKQAKNEEEWLKEAAQQVGDEPEGLVLVNRGDKLPEEIAVQPDPEANYGNQAEPDDGDPHNRGSEA